jgi:hypothetical protein
MYTFNHPDFHFDGRKRRFGKSSKNNKISKQINDMLEQSLFEHEGVITEVFTPKQAWQPIKLINEERGVAHTILVKMRWSDIARKILQDHTDASALSALVKGKRKTINGWRCEYL